jgi:hypothetical protein
LDDDDKDLQWVGSMMYPDLSVILTQNINVYTYRITAQIIGPRTHESFVEGHALQDLDLVVGLNRNQYASFTWNDMWAIAPWMKDKITKRIDGLGLGN